MKIKDFTEHPEVFHLVRKLKEDGVDKKPFSDVLDKNNKQYVDLVQEGGGVLGVALIGYTYVLEQIGIRFFSYAGTSAGSINALLLASLDDLDKAKSEKLIKLLANKNLFDFVDGDSDAKDFIKAIVEKVKRVKLIWKAIQVIDNIFENLGLNPGDNFFNWLRDILKDNKIITTNDLLDKLNTLPPGLIIRKGVGRTIEGLNPRFTVITADLSTETKVEFPRMNSLYWKDPDTTNPAYYVRGSMSIPYFFSPMIIKNLPQGPEALVRWENLAKYEGEIPDAAYFVDGGIMSNFPIDIFHKFNTVPRLPTFGIRLGVNRNDVNKISNPLNLFGAMFNSIRHLHDYDFLLKHPDYEMLVKHIDIGDHNWLNFNLSENDKIDLFTRGAKAADSFLRNFDWQKYKERRKKLITEL